ncbi:Uncharacterised protein [Candidatus Gugararchaeum adminiculabundum]|nr:Uncharacterised protein [Candidatus Gugararchaeum adminiculabundum]
MDETVGPKINELEAKKQELIVKVVEINKQLRYKEHKLEAIKGLVSGEKAKNPFQLKRELKKLEFEISQSMNAKRERELIKEVRIKEEEFEKARELDHMRRKVSLVEGDIELLKKEQLEIDKQIQEVRAGLKTQYDSAKLNRKEVRRKSQDYDQREKNREEARKEMEPFLGEIDHNVSLEDICIIKKKN